ncbi:DNA-binding transcriptional regulator YbjK [Gordonia malaquae]|uniref:Putative TetR family transcriptional regulator n=1 Tax=Gordonia malaquae NBRC 108250 TaxID=1223542 RepID=M3VBZ3_GORML|nr:TetR family transcriptional regulator [Gordonia malaquae]GAC81113.1 putative TetR family transcriptional regulator [Gordonia malaquae NBRC 108250]SEB99199.1 DNA-binding transcriptional regulator YbjK [Gordonia malaquae]
MARLSLEQRRQAAITATLRVIGTDGVEAATTRRIAAEAKMGQSSIFYAFASRDELLAAVVEYGIAEELAAMDGWLQLLAEFPANDAPIEDLMRGALQSFAENAINDSARQHALIGLALYARRTEGLEYLAERLYDGYYAVAERLLDEAARISGVRFTKSTHELAPSVIAITDGLTLCWLGTASREQVDRVIETGVSLFIGFVDTSDE